MQIKNQLTCSSAIFLAILSDICALIASFLSFSSRLKQTEINHHKTAFYNRKLTALAECRLSTEDTPVSSDFPLPVRPVPAFSRLPVRP